MINASNLHPSPSTLRTHRSTSHSTLLLHISSYSPSAIHIRSLMALLSIVFNRSQLVCAVTKALIAPFRIGMWKQCKTICCYKHINQSISPIRAISAKAKDINEMRRRLKHTLPVETGYSLNLKSSSDNLSFLLNRTELDMFFLRILRSQFKRFEVLWDGKLYSIYSALKIKENLEFLRIELEVPVRSGHVWNGKVF